MSELKINEKIAEGRFSEIERELLIHLDEYDNIQTTFVQEADAGPDAPYAFPTRCGFIRNAEEATPLSERLPPDHKEIRAINALLRGLNVVSAIAFVVEYKSQQQSSKLPAQEALADLKTSLLQYADQILNFAQAPDGDTRKYYQNLEAQFHTKILKILHTQNLTRGLKYPSDYADLLEHYRNFASLLSPAASVITKYKYDNFGQTIYLTDTAHPITKKTDVQKAQIQLMKRLNKDSDTPHNYHSVQAPAFQVASSAFADLLARDDTALGGQTRYTIAPTAKNAFTVVNEITFPKGSSLWQAVRTGTIAYVGPGETPESCAIYAAENIKQMQEAGRKMGKDKLFFTLLLTNHYHNKQSAMVTATRTAGETTGTSVSLMPLNLIGVSYPLEYSTELAALAAAQQQALPATQTSYLNLLNRRLRTENAATVLNIIVKDPTAAPIAGCATGQDRTGTLLEISLIKWITAECKAKGMDVTEEQIAELRAPAGHNAFMASVTVPGAPGLKMESDPGYFSPLIARYHYRDLAEFNKNPSIDHYAVTALIGPAAKVDLQKTFADNLSVINQATTTEQVIKAVIPTAQAVSIYQRNKPDYGLFAMVASVFRFFNKGTSDETGLAVRELITEMAESLADSNPHNPVSFQSLLTEINDQMQRTKTVYSKDQLGTVFDSLEKMVDVAAQKLKTLAPAEEKSSISLSHNN